MMKYLATVTGKLIAIGAGLLLVVLALTLGPAACNAIRGLTAQTKVDAAQHNALATSAGEAIATQGNVATNAAASEDLSRSNEQDIRHAKGADQAIDPAARDAGFASLCKRAAFRNNPANRLRCAPPAVVAGARPRS